MGSLAVVIPAFRSERTIRRCLELFAEEAPDAELIVVDSSPDGASAAVARSVGGVSVLVSERRLLPHAARNLGAASSDAPLVLFTDPDIYPRKGAVAALLAAQRATRGAVAAAVTWHGTSSLDRAAHYAKYDSWLPRPGLGPIAIAPTSGLLVTREAWARVGRIPELGMLGDTVFSWALVDAGVPLHLAGDAVFEHDHGAALGTLVRERYARGREFAPLRQARRPGRGRRAVDLALTLSLLRPARVTARSVSAAWRYGGHAGAVASLPVVAASQLAWFTGELVGMTTGPGTTVR